MALDSSLRDRLDEYRARLFPEEHGLLNAVLAALCQLDDTVRKLAELLDSPEWRDRR